MRLCTAALLSKTQRRARPLGTPLLPSSSNPPVIFAVCGAVVVARRRCWRGGGGGWCEPAADIENAVTCTPLRRAVTAVVPLPILHPSRRFRNAWARHRRSAALLVGWWWWLV